jgi:hypothetical protein
MLHDAECRQCIVEELDSTGDEDDADTAELIRLALRGAMPEQALAELVAIYPNRRTRIARAAERCRRQNDRCASPGTLASAS